MPGIHGVLRAGGLDQGYLPDGDYLARGRAVHKATLLYDLGASLGAVEEWRPEWEPYFEAYRAFRARVRSRWRWLEHPRVHRTLGYASIIDRVGEVEGHPALVEIKTGYPAAFHGPQLAGADLLLTGRVRLGLRRRLGVYLFRTGQFQVREYDEAVDYHRFMGAVAQYWEAA